MSGLELVTEDCGVAAEVEHDLSCRARLAGEGSVGAEVEVTPVGAGEGPFLFVAGFDDVITAVSYRDAAAIDPEIAADWDELQLLRHRLFSRIISCIPDNVLASGLTPTAASDTAWAIASPETFDLLVRRLHYTLDDFHDWPTRTLDAALLASD